MSSISILPLESSISLDSSVVLVYPAGGCIEIVMSLRVEILLVVNRMRNLFFMLR